MLLHSRTPKSVPQVAPAGGVSMVGGGFVWFRQAQQEIVFHHAVDSTHCVQFREFV